MAPLDLLMLAPTPFFADRGCHVRILGEARALLERGHQVRVVTYGLGRDVPGIEVRRCLRLPGYRKLEAGPSWAKPLLDAFLAAAALAAARERRPDLIHAHLHEGVMVGALLRRVVGVPLLFDYQGGMVEESLAHGFLASDGLARKLLGRLESRLDAAADAVITSTTRDRDLLAARLAPGRVTAVPDAVDLERFRPLPDPRAARRALGLPLERPVVAFVGLLTPYQGVDLLLEAALEVSRARPDVLFLLMGYPDVERYLERAQALGLGERVRFTGRVGFETLPEWLGAADLAVAPKVAATEGNGKVALYMAAGLATVAFDTPVNRELLGEWGAYVPLGDAGALARRVVDLLDDPQERSRLGAGARARAERDLSTRAMAERIEAVYQRLVPGRGRLPDAT